MKYTLLIGTLLSLGCAAGNLQAAALNLFNTGVDSSASVLATGTADPHWTVASGSLTFSSSPAYVLNDQKAGIYVQGSASAWIFSDPGAGGTGLSTFTLEFDLSGFDYTTASITGSFAVDNEATIFLNESSAGIGTGALSQTGYTSAAFTGWHNFTLNNGFQPGLNRLEFVVNNIDSVGGLNVTLEGSALAVPEPAAASFSALAGVGLLLRRRRK